MVYTLLNKAKQSKKTLLGVLVDPEKYSSKEFKLLSKLVNSYADLILVGGSLTTTSKTDNLFKEAKRLCKKPIVIFPGPGMPINKNADAIFLLSLISGRNPELLVGRHIENAFNLAESGLEIIPTGYILIDGGIETSVSYMSQTRPIPPGKTDIISATALAGQQLGLRCIYLEAGSGAVNPVNKNTVSKIAQITNIPIIVGGGIKNGKTASDLAKSGATLLVIGNILEENPKKIVEIKNALKHDT